MDSDRDDITDFGGDYTTVAPIELKERKLFKTHRLWVTLVFGGYALLVVLAVVLSGLSLKNDSDQKDNLLVSACEQANVSRRNTYESLITLAILSVQTRADQPETASPLVTRYVEYLNLAFDPLNCDIDNPNFGIDTTPPIPLPVNNYFSGSPYGDK